MLLLSSRRQHLITSPQRLCHSEILFIAPSADAMHTSLQDIGMPGWEYAQLHCSWSLKHSVQP